MSGKRVIAGVFGIVALFWLALGWAYGGGKVDAEDVLRDEWRTGRAAMETVAGDLLRRADLSGISGDTYRGADEAYRLVFDGLKFMSAEKRGNHAVLFVRKKSLGFELGLLYVREGELPALDYARVARLDPHWYAVTVRDPRR